ncbi:hypothetical protein TrST_g5085 [Triparma strigata]|uniref:TATA element modulatory factor 1 TATA binding domain-containing protein n=1 Tax=Triparma strigata TaxID=1606541 RepID=A0A9W7B304_9STRA|nr:hypothetical protein TrST_g5085 [Triparma strigata]
MWGNLLETTANIASKIEANLNESVGVAPSSLPPRDYDPVPPQQVPQTVVPPQPTVDNIDNETEDQTSTPSDQTSTPSPVKAPQQALQQALSPSTPQINEPEEEIKSPPVTVATPNNTSSNSDMAAEVVLLRSEGQSLMLKLNKLQTSYRSLASMNKKLTSDLSKTVAQCNERDSLIEDLKNDKGSKDSTLKEKDEEIIKLKEEVMVLENKREIDGKARVDELEATLRKKEEDLTTLRRDYEEINNKLNKSSVAQLKTEKSLRTKFGNLENKLKADYELKKQKVTSEVSSDYAASETSLRQSIESYRSSLSASEEQNGKLQLQVSRLQSALKQKDELFEQIEASIQEWTAREKESKEELEKAKREKDSIQTLLDKEKKNSDRVEFVYKKRFEEAGAERDSLKMDNSKLKNEIVSLQKLRMEDAETQAQTTPRKKDAEDVESMGSPVGGMVGGIMLRNEINEKKEEINFLKKRVEELEEAAANHPPTEDLADRLKEKELEVEELKGDLDDVKQCYGREVHRLTMILANGGKEPENNPGEEKKTVVVEVQMEEEKSLDVNDFRLGMFVD